MPVTHRILDHAKGGAGKRMVPRAQAFLLSAAHHT